MIFLTTSQCKEIASVQTSIIW